MGWHVGGCFERAIMSWGGGILIRALPKRAYLSVACSWNQHPLAYPATCRRNQYQFLHSVTCRREQHPVHPFEIASTKQQTWSSRAEPREAVDGPDKGEQQALAHYNGMERVCEIYMTSADCSAAINLSFYRPTPLVSSESHSAHWQLHTSWLNTQSPTFHFCTESAVLS